MYKIVSSNVVLRISDGTYIPFAPGNRDYADYLGWVADGNTPISQDATPLRAVVVSPRQIRQALTQVNLRSQVENAIAASNIDLQDWWEYATEIDRSHPEVNAMASALGKTEEEVDEIFALAASL